MQAACAAMVWLEGAGRDADGAAAALWAAAREPWLARELLHYHARTGAARALELLARAPEPHARHLLDALHEQLRAEPPLRRHALAALAALAARRPPWLQRLAAHPLARDLVRAARAERSPLPLLHALLALAALLPAAPALAAPLLPELAELLLRPAPPAARAHLQLAQLALFHALYATHPLSLLDTLRAELAAASARDAWEHGLAPLVASVRLHPGLVTGSRQQEADPARWARLELHDVVAEARRLSLHSPPPRAPADPPPPAPAPPPEPGSAALAARAAATLRPGAEPWFSLADRCGAESAPHTPLPGDADASEPPEAAVEATPENTPAKETRAQFRFPGESGAVRAIGRKETSPPAGEGPAGRLARVLAERRAAESPVPLSGAPPTHVARPEPRPADAADWPPPEPAEALQRARQLDPRRRLAAPAPPRAPARPPRRARSCSGRLCGARSQSVAVQTVDTWPEPYEFLIADFYRTFPEADAEGRETAHPCQLLDRYLDELYRGGAGTGAGELAEQLALTHALLMYERWRREAHAERNRRLLGRCRSARALELQNQALRDRVRRLAADNDELRARRARDGDDAAAHAERAERDSLEAALALERAARARAEAALAEAEALRAADAAELQRTRGESFEAARHVEELARAATAAERRAEHVRRLRRELLVLAEREARLAEAVRIGSARGAAPPADDRALRAACARAEADAVAAGARADAAVARAHELEAALGARDAALAELKRAARAAADEQAARLRAAQDKYAALLRVARAHDAAALARRGAAGRWPARLPRDEPS